MGTMGSAPGAARGSLSTVCACAPTDIIGTLGVQPDAQGDGHDANGGETGDERGDATAGAADGAPGDALADTQGDVHACLGPAADAGPLGRP